MSDRPAFVCATGKTHHKAAPKRCGWHIAALSSRDYPLPVQKALGHDRKGADNPDSAASSRSRQESCLSKMRIHCRDRPTFDGSLLQTGLGFG